MYRYRNAAIATTVLLMSVGLAVRGNAQGRPLENSGFDTPDPKYHSFPYVAEAPGNHASIPSSADRWGIYNNADATTTTLLVPSTAENGGDYMMLVQTGGADCGICQNFNLLQKATASVHVFVVVGTVYVRLTTGGGTIKVGQQQSTKHGQWETIWVPATSKETNEILIYSLDGPATFYVDNASVKDVSPQAKREKSPRR